MIYYRGKDKRLENIKYAKKSNGNRNGLFTKQLIIWFFNEQTVRKSKLHSACSAHHLTAPDRREDSKMGILSVILSPKVLNPLLSIFDQEARELVQRIAATVPDNSFLPSERFGGSFDVLKGIIEGLDTGPLKPLVEKLTDYGDFLSVELTDGGRGEKPETVLQGWMNKFFAEAGGRLEKAADPETELEKIKKEFAARLELLKMIEAAAKQYAEEKKRRRSPGPPKVGGAADRFIDNWKLRAQNRGYTERRKS